MKNLVPLLVFASCLTSCSNTYKTKKVQAEINFVTLNDDLSSIPDSTFRLIDKWLIGAEIIGLSEGVHGMNEPLNFRNSYIKHLVKSNQIQVLAFESGILESKMVNDYIQGRDLDLDSVLTNGFSYTFGQFNQNKELLIWLRKINSARSKENNIRFYGFDMAGNAPNPHLEKSAYALEECLKYLNKVDIINYQNFLLQVNEYIPYLCILNNADKYELSFADLTESKRKSYRQILETLKKLIEENKSKYVSIAGHKEYNWGLQSLTCAQQNLTFLIDFHKQNIDQSSREKFMLDNLKWIRLQEGDRRILLYAHISHLAKDISRINENGENMLPEKMFGENIADFYGEKYKVIGNLFSQLDYYEEIDSVLENSLPSFLFKKYQKNNFCIKVNHLDTLLSKPWIFGVPFKGNLWTTPTKGMDVIFYTHKQHYFYKE